VLIDQENSLDLRLSICSATAVAFPRGLRARLTQLGDQLVLWPNESNQLRRPALAHDVNDILAQEVSTRFDDYEVIVTDVDESLRLPASTLPWPVGDMNVLDANAARRRCSRRAGSGHSTLVACSRAGPRGARGDHQWRRADAAVERPRACGRRRIWWRHEGWDRGRLRRAVALPAPVGELLLPPVKSVHLGVSVLNGTTLINRSR